jgi:hypothetical protein
VTWAKPVPGTVAATGIRPSSAVPRNSPPGSSIEIAGPCAGAASRAAAFNTTAESGGTASASRVPASVVTVASVPYTPVKAMPGE